MAKVVVTLEFDSVEASIAALGKVAGLVAAPAAAPKSDAPAAEKPPRKGRADAGVPRGPHKPTEPIANATGAGAAAPVGTTASAAVTQAAPVAAAPAPQPTPPVAIITAPIADDTVQAAVEKLFNKIDYDGTFAALSKFGVKRGKDLPQPVRAEFLQRVEDLVAGKYGVNDSWPSV
jgi:hypothetical protein